MKSCAERAVKTKPPVIKPMPVRALGTLLSIAVLAEALN
jgi:hypothetical protein